jgi:hypothetical protein
LWLVTRVASVTFIVSAFAAVPKSTRELATLSVVQVIFAVVLPGIATTDEITGGALTVTKLAGKLPVGGEVAVLPEESAEVTR